MNLVAPNGGNVPFQPGDEFRPWEMFQCYHIPLWLVRYRARGIDWGAMMLWGKLAYHMGQNGTAYPSYGRIANDLQVTPQTVQNWAKKLKTAGLVGWDSPDFSERGNHKSNVYRFFWPDDISSDDLRQAMQKDLERGTQATLVSPTQVKLEGVPKPICNKEKHIREPRKRTTEPSGSQRLGVVSSLNSSKLGEEQREYINLKLAQGVKEGSIRSPNAYRAVLERKAKEQALSMDDFHTLKSWQDVGCKEREEQRQRQGEKVRFNQNYSILKKYMNSKKIAVSEVCKTVVYDKEGVAGLECRDVLLILKTRYCEQLDEVEREKDREVYRRNMERLKLLEG